MKGQYLQATIDTITAAGLQNSTSNMCKINDLLLVTRIEPAKAIIAKIEVAVNQDIKIIKSHLSANFLYYYFSAFRTEYERKASGSTVQGISLPNIQSTEIPLPPIAEQHRIVDRIESLFAKLDEAKEKAQTVVDSFETRKAAILHKAFTGELTRLWRIKQHIEKNWFMKKMSEVCDVRDGTHDSPQYHSTGFPLVTSKNLKNDVITDKGLKYISLSDYKQINLRSKVDIGDILFAMIGTIGSPVVVTERPNYAIKNVALFKNINKINSFFLKYYLESEYVTNKMTNEAKGTTQKFVPLGYLRNFLVPVPSEPEQIEIVRIIDSLLSKEQQAKDAAEAVIDQIDTMKKSILARAFRGELGTNDPAEEWAGEVVKSILK